MQYDDPSAGDADARKARREKANRVKRARKIQEQTRRRVLAVIQKYYAPHLASVVLACCVRQRAGDFTRCCRKRLCPPCASRESFTIARRQLDAFNTFSPTSKRARIQHEVYTIPPSLHVALLAPGGLARLRQSVLATLREIHGAHVSGVMNLHPIGDDPSKLHPHLDVVINAWTVQDGRVVLTRPRIDFDHARDVFKANIEKAFELEPASLPAIDLFIDTKGGITKSNPRKVWHIIRYSAREVYQPAWARLDTQNQNDEDWLYKAKKEQLPRRYDGPRVMRNLNRIEAWLYGQRRRVWFGGMKDKQRAATLRIYHPEGAS